MDKHAQGTRFLNRWNHFYHGASGRKRAQDVLDLIKKPGTSEQDVLDAAKKAFQASGCARHSYSRYLYNELFTVSGRTAVDRMSDKDFKKLKGDVAFEVAKTKLAL